MSDQSFGPVVYDVGLEKSCEHCADCQRPTYKCQCDFAGLRVQRRIAALEATLAGETKVDKVAPTLDWAERVVTQDNELRARIAELEKDRERLEWMVANQAWVAQQMCGATHDRYDRVIAEREPVTWTHSWREAIDAAMEGK